MSSLDELKNLASMHEYLFYLSYVERDFESSLERFSEDLRREVELLTVGEAPVSFMDRQSLRPQHGFERGASVSVSFHNPCGAGQAPGGLCPQHDR